MDYDLTLRPRLSRFLHAETLDGFPAKSAVMNATQRLNSLHKTLSSFLPLYIAQDEDNLVRDYAKLSNGTFMFADVSGFTALSERLMEQAGPEGIEILTHIFNDYFSTMLEVVAKSNGELLKFAGDALLIFFPEEANHHEGLKAINAGLRMQRIMQERYQPIHNADLARWFGANHDLALTMSVGISQGRLFEALVGSLAQRDHMVMGRLPGMAMAAEEIGVRDDVIIDAGMAERYRKEFRFKALSEGFYQVVDDFGSALGDFETFVPTRRRSTTSGLLAFDKRDLLDDLEHALSRLENISRFVSSEIVNRLVVKGDHMESENRLTTVIFVHFTGITELLEALGEDKLDLVKVILSRYYAVMQRVIAARGGVLTRSDPYKLGSKLLITFGAPIAHADDNERAVATALEMHRQLEIFNQRLRHELPDYAHLYPFIRQRMGISQGKVFAGEVGWRQRREYTVNGDDVNLAARLMAKSEFGDVTVSQRVWETVHHRFTTEALPLMHLKGKSHPIQAYLAQGRKEEEPSTLSNTPFVGRDVLHLTLNQGLEDAYEGLKRPSKGVTLVGENGVGKTRLARQLAETAADAGFKVAWATCRLQNTRKTTWATLLRQLLEIDSNAPREVQEARLKEWLERLRFKELEDVFTDLIFHTDTDKETKKAETRSRSRARSDIFERLSSTETLAMKKDDMMQMKEQMSKALDNKVSPGVTLWKRLELSVGVTHALTRFLRKFSQTEAPVLIVIDDAHRDNPNALHILQHVAENVMDTRIMLVTTQEPDSNLDVALARIPVDDFTEDEAYLMAATILDVAELGPRLSRFVWEKTKGRPLFIESLLRVLIEGDHLIEEQGVVELAPGANVQALPDNIRGLIISRIDRLPDNARSLVRWAAVLGDSFTQPQLTALTGLHPEVVKDIVQNLIRLHILDEQDGEAHHFRHGVTQQAVYAELNRAQRQQLHVKVADYYMQLSNADAYVNTRIDHLLKADIPTLAVSVITKEGEKAEAEGNIALAGSLYDRGLQAYPDNPDLLERMNRLLAQA